MERLKLFEQACTAAGCVCRRDVLMKHHTSFKIGGPADLFVRLFSPAQAKAALAAAKEYDVPVTVVGRGSNLLVGSAGIRGAVLLLDDESASPSLVDETTIFCPAGVGLARLCKFALANSLTGLEFAYGIPASVGGAVYMNAGAYGGEMKDALLSVQFITPEGALLERDASELDLRYRHTWFGDHPKNLITGATFSLTRGDPQKILARMEEVMAARKQKQPLEYPSAGSTFKRPPGAYAAALIDECGLKGRRVGGAMVSEKHAGFLINYDNASYEDMCALIDVVKREVYEKKQIALECEVKFL